MYPSCKSILLIGLCRHLRISCNSCFYFIFNMICMSLDMICISKRAINFHPSISIKANGITSHYSGQPRRVTTKKLILFYQIILRFTHCKIIVIYVWAFWRHINICYQRKELFFETPCFSYQIGELFKPYSYKFLRKKKIIKARDEWKTVQTFVPLLVLFKSPLDRLLNFLHL